jgi:hypothetical protein
MDATVDNLVNMRKFIPMIGCAKSKVAGKLHAKNGMVFY